MSKQHESSFLYDRSKERLFGWTPHFPVALQLALIKLLTCKSKQQTHHIGFRLINLVDGNNKRNCKQHVPITHKQSLVQHKMELKYPLRDKLTKLMYEDCRYVYKMQPKSKSPSFCCNLTNADRFYFSINSGITSFQVQSEITC